MLSAWFRMKYPHIVDGALAASAPIILTIPGYRGKPTFYETTTQNYAKSNPICPVIVREAFYWLLVNANTPEGLEMITQEMKLCKPVKTEEDINQLVLWAVTAFGNLAMSDYPYPTDFGIKLPGYPINLSCQFLVNNSQNLLYALSQAVGVFYNGTDGNLPCFDIYNEFIFCADQTGCGTGPLAQAWDYQACTEINFPEATNTNGITDMFPARNFTLANLSEYCQKTWEITPRPNWLITEYGGDVEVKYATNIIFSNGLLDPWHGGGVLVNYSQSLPSLIIAEGAHHLDLRGSNPLDPPSVIWVRASEANYFINWLKEKNLKNGRVGSVSLRTDSAPWTWVKRLKERLEMK
jgi:dipeptidyl-peptidase-2